MFFFVLFLVVLTTIIQFIRKRYQFWTERNVVQDAAYPLFGINFKSILGKSSVAEVFQCLYNKYPHKRYIGVYDFTSPILMIKNPDLLKQITIKDFDYFTDHRPKFPKDINPLWNRSLFNLIGLDWREMRTTLSPAHTGSKMKGMFILMEQCAKNMVEYFVQQNQEIVEIEARETFSRYTNDVIASTTCGFECDSFKEKNNDFYTKGIKITDMIGLWKFIKFDLLRVFPWFGKILEVELFDKEITQFFRTIIKENVEFRKEKKIERPDMIALLMRDRKETKKADNDSELNFAAVKEYNLADEQKPVNFTIDDIAGQALLFFFSGFGTVSSVLSFLTYELAVNPDVQNRLIEEIDQFRSKNEKFTYEGLCSLSYLDMVMSETLRKWPSFMRSDRVCTKPYTIKPETPDETLLSISKGQILWIPIDAIQHDDKYWPDPEKFDPDRFSAENKTKIVPGTYLPFGIGPRNCIASRFTIQKVKVAICEILSTFEIVTTEKTVIPCQPYKKSSALLPGDGFWFGLKVRKVLTKND